jgi:hypothetical protein
MSNVQFFMKKETTSSGLLGFGLCPLTGILKNNVLMTDQISEMLCSLEYWTVEYVQNPCNLECHTPVPEPFRI